MKKNLSDTARLTEKLSPPSLDLDCSLLPIRLRPADVARLFGVSRARVTQLVQSGRISALPDGSIDPNRACQELIRRDPGGARSKVLVTLRVAMEDAHRQRDAALAERDRLAGIATEALAAVDALRDALRKVSREWLEVEWTLSELTALGGDVLDRVADDATAAALKLPLHELAEGADPEILRLLRTLDPDCELNLMEGGDVVS